jgi:hypothetical protein
LPTFLPTDVADFCADDTLADGFDSVFNLADGFAFAMAFDLDFAAAFLGACLRAMSVSLLDRRVSDEVRPAFAPIARRPSTFPCHTCRLRPGHHAAAVRTSPGCRAKACSPDQPRAFKPRSNAAGRPRQLRI